MKIATAPLSPFQHFSFQRFSVSALGFVSAHGYFRALNKGEGKEEVSFELVSIRVIRGSNSAFPISAFCFLTSVELKTHVARP